MKTKNKITLLATAFAIAAGFTSCLKPKDEVVPPPTPVDTTGNVYVYKWIQMADSAQTSLDLFWIAGSKYYSVNNSSGDWTQYWPSAHALDVLVDRYLRSPSAATKTRMDDLLAGVKAKNGNTFINFYYDDMEWMTLACLRAFEATNDQQYKDVAQLLWADIKSGWSMDLGGGIWWRKDNSSKNAPSNLPAAIIAARFYKTFDNPDDLQWAQKIYNWQKATLYDAANGLVYDNIAANGNVNTSWKFTYNQGTFIGAALELYSITSNASYMTDALKAADYTLQSGQLTDVTNGILKNEGGGDGGLFKGVFVRYFTRLIVEGGLESTKKTQYINFMKTNAQKLWRTGMSRPQLLFGTAWNVAPATSTDFTTQLSGIMLIEALAELKKLNLVD